MMMKSQLQQQSKQMFHQQSTVTPAASVAENMKFVHSIWGPALPLIHDQSLSLSFLICRLRIKIPTSKS